MRHFLPFFLVLQVAVLTGCAVKPFPAPKIEGRVGSISHDDIVVVTALTERHMRYHIGWALPIDRIVVRDHDYIAVIYSYGPHEYRIPMTRVHGTWVSPAPDSVMVTG
jgi:hypothetical protein